MYPFSEETFLMERRDETITTEFVHSLIVAQDLSRLADETGLPVVWTSF